MVSYLHIMYINISIPYSSPIAVSYLPPWLLSLLLWYLPPPRFYKWEETSDTLFLKSSLWLWTRWLPVPPIYLQTTWLCSSFWLNNIHTSFLIYLSTTGTWADDLTWLSTEACRYIYYEPRLFWFSNNSLLGGDLEANPASELSV